MVKAGPCILALLAAVVLLGPCAAVAQDDGAVPTTSVGAWTLSVEDGSRQCRLLLRGDVLGEGHAVGMPPGCHRAFPALAKVVVWTETGAGRIQFEDAAGQPLLAFEPGADGGLTGTGGEGEVLRLSPSGPHRPVVLAAAGEKPAPRATRKDGKGTDIPPVGPLPSAAEVAGHYAVLREAERDTGCMVTLDAKAHGPGGTLKANLAPACRDQGIVIFDPVGWRLSGGHLVLTARKGHTTALGLQADGTWEKVPKQGKVLGLKRI